MTLNLVKRAVSVLALMLVAGVAGCQHHEPPAKSASLEPSTNTPVAALDGFVWQSSAPQSKLDFLLGVECAMAMEAAMKQVAEERGGTVHCVLFVKFAVAYQGVDESISGFARAHELLAADAETVECS